MRPSSREWGEERREVQQMEEERIVGRHRLRPGLPPRLSGGAEEEPWGGEEQPVAYADHGETLVSWNSGDDVQEGGSGHLSAVLL